VECILEDGEVGFVAYTQMLGHSGEVRLFVAVMCTRIKGGWEMSAWLVIVLLMTWRVQSAASFQFFFCFIILA